jgi:hypothetical protein
MIDTTGLTVVDTSCIAMKFTVEQKGYMYFTKVKGKLVMISGPCA